MTFLLLFMDTAIQSLSEEMDVKGIKKRKRSKNKLLTWRAFIIVFPVKSKSDCWKHNNWKNKSFFKERFLKMAHVSF